MTVRSRSGAYVSIWPHRARFQPLAMGSYIGLPSHREFRSEIVPGALRVYPSSRLVAGVNSVVYCCTGRRTSAAGLGGRRDTLPTGRVGARYILRPSAVARRDSAPFVLSRLREHLLNPPLGRAECRAPSVRRHLPRHGAEGADGETTGGLGGKPQVCCRKSRRGQRHPQARVSGAGGWKQARVGGMKRFGRGLFACIRS